MYYFKIILIVILSNFAEDNHVVGITEGSGNSCAVYNPCINGGSCIEGSICVCGNDWTGSHCENKKDKSMSILDAGTSMMYTLITTRKTIDAAADECKKRFGRIVSNVEDSKVIVALNMLQDKASQSLGELGNKAMQQFWAFPGKYPDKLPHLTNDYCTTTSFNGTISKLSCQINVFPFVCAKPTSGYCYPEISREKCKPPKDMCKYNTTSLNCACREGFTEDDKDKTQCVDISDCRSHNWPCNFVNTICQNIPGGFRCGCSEGKQGNGVDMCGYVTTMEQVGVDLTKIPEIKFNVSVSTPSPPTSIPNLSQLITTQSFTTSFRLNSPSFLKMPIDDVDLAKEKLQDKLLVIFKISTTSIKRVVVKTISPSLKYSKVIYDVWSQYPDVTPTSIREFYKEAERRGKLYWLEGSKPVEAPVACTPSTLGVSKIFYNFSSSEPGAKGVSIQRCDNGRNIATVECKVKINNDGSRTAYYDYKTVSVIPCYITLDTVTDLVTDINSIQAVESAMSDLDSLTSDYTQAGSGIFEQAVESMSKVANYLWDSNIDISSDTMTSMVNVADNINKAQKYDRETNGRAQLNSTQRQEIVQALEKCSVHVKTKKSETLKISSQSVTLQITNVLPPEVLLPSSQFISGISFNHFSPQEPNTLFPSPGKQQCRLKRPPAVRSFIPFGAVEQAKKMKTENSTATINLPVSFVYFTDSEFFTPHSDKYEIEQVLSAQISNLELKNLKNPVWFQIPQTTNDKNPKVKKYYKCSFLNEETGEWMSDGCVTIPGSNPPNCTCNHMTNFAVLVQHHEKLQEYSLEIVGKVCCVISIFGILFMLLIHLYFPSLRKSEIIKIHSHLGFNLMVSYIILLSSTERPKPYGLCIASAAILHFFLLSSWGWMLVECITMYRKLVKVFSKAVPHYVSKAAIVVYFLSAIIVITTLLISVAWYDSTNFDGWITPGSDFFPSSYVSDRLCWLHSYSLIFGFLIPVAIAFVISSSGAILILWSITCGRKQIRSNSANPTDVRSYVLRAITISVLLGLSWIFAIPLTLSDDPTVNSVFGWLFSISNALQGFFMFLLFCVRREDVRDMWINELRNFFKDENRDSTADSRDMLPDETTTMASNDNIINTNRTEVSQDNGDSNTIALTDMIYKTPQNTTYSSNDRDFGRIGKISTFHPIAHVDQDQT